MICDVQHIPTVIDGQEGAFFVAIVEYMDVAGLCKVAHDPDGSAILIDLFVKEAYRRCGVGSAIVTAVIAETPRHLRLRAYTLPTSPAIGILERAGFQDDGGRGVDGLDGDYVWRTCVR